MTVDALVTILAHVAGDQRLRGPFDASLPIAGRDGSLVNRMKGTPAEGNASGEPLVFAILANNFDVPGPTISATEDAIVVRLATFAR